MGMTSEMAKFRGAISSMYQSIEELEETNTPPTLIQKLMNNVQEVLDTLEEALFFNTDVEDDTNINQAQEERLDLACPHCGSRVYDNRIRKTDPAQPSFNERSPDFICSNDTDCTGMIQGKTRLLRASWYLKDLNGNPKDLPREWNI